MYIGVFFLLFVLRRLSISLLLLLNRNTCKVHETLS